MRKIWIRIAPILLAAMLLVLIPASSIGVEYKIVYYTSSGLQTTDIAIKASAGWLGGVLIITDGTNDVTLILYDDPDSADGTELFKAKVAGGDNYGGVMFPLPLEFSNGCWADVEGTSPEYIVYHR